MIVELANGITIQSPRLLFQDQAGILSCVVAKLDQGVGGSKSFELGSVERAGPLFFFCTVSRVYRSKE
jgi:hypothetical protein